MTDFLKIAKSIVVHFAHICAYGVETGNHSYCGNADAHLTVRNNYLSYRWTNMNFYMR